MPRFDGLILNVFYILWEYTVRSGKRRQFQRHYSSEGTWAKFFRRDPDYVETILLRNQRSRLRYVTIDVWERGNSYRKFKRRFKAEYEVIDHRFETLTLKEHFLGYFEIPDLGM